MIQLCKNKVPCSPCPDDSPILNLSAELPDSPLFLGTFDWADPPPVGNVYSSRGCYSWCFSKISQQDADDCARRSAQLCAWTDGGGPTLGCGGSSGLCAPVQHDNYRQRTSYFNSPQTCSILCPDGSLFIDTVPAGTILSVMSQADADERAASLCQKRIKNRMLCWLDAVVPDGVVGQGYAPFALRVEGGIHPYHFTVIGGALPNGIVLSDDGVLSGTPTVSGSSTFTVQVIDANFPASRSQRSFTINVTMPSNVTWTVTPLAGRAGSGIGGACTGIVTVQSDHGPLQYTNDARTNNSRNNFPCLAPCGDAGLSSKYESNTLGPFAVLTKITVSGTVVLRNAVFNDLSGVGCNSSPGTFDSASEIEIDDSVDGLVTFQSDSCNPGQSPKTVAILLNYNLPVGRTAKVSGLLSAWGAGMISSINVSVTTAPV